MTYLVAISDKHKVHIIEAGGDINLTEVPAVCGCTSEKWQIAMDLEEAWPAICQRCRRKLFKENK